MRGGGVLFPLAIAGDEAAVGHDSMAAGHDGHDFEAGVLIVQRGKGEFAGLNEGVICGFATADGFGPLGDRLLLCGVRRGIECR
jgi:hypothetical protein